MESLTDRINAYGVTNFHSQSIACLNCHGKGYVRALGYDGMWRPVTCRGCNGTGNQRVRPCSLFFLLHP